MSRIVFRCLVFVSLLLLALPALAQDDVPRFEAGDCPFQVPAGTTWDCGFVVVPEDRTDPDNTNTLRIATAIQRGDGSSPDPVVLLAGGPGESVIPSAAVYASLFGQISGDRDLVFFDQRGAGASEPSLQCPGFTEAYIANLNEADPVAAAQNFLTFYGECREALVEAGYNLNAFDTVQNAADVNDIATALGYEQVNLLGVSYGSLLAQSVMRDFPEIVRSVIIDSVLPTTRSFFVDTSISAPTAVERLLDTCQADEACNAAYPDLRQTFYDTVERLNAEPEPLTITNPNTGETYDMQLTGDAVVSTLLLFLYQTPIIPLLPQAIYTVSQGDYELISQLNGQILPQIGALTRGMQFATQCADDLIGRDPAVEYPAMIETLPEAYRGRLDPEQIAEISIAQLCNLWNVEALDPSVKEPVISDIPALVFAGEFDPVTPPNFAAEVAENLENSYFYTVPSTGHSVNVASGCARSVSADFIEDPTTEPDASCIDAIAPVEFAVPSTEIAFEPLESEMFGYTSILPEGWTEIQPGVYAQNADNPSILLLQQALPGTLADATGLLSTQLGMELSEPDSTYEGDGLTWSLYEVSTSGVLLDLAFAEADGTTFIVLLQSSPAQRAQFYEPVFLPVLDALTPAS
jgi:pimeloyl-ACP methyl ester carboxylesterase